MANTIEASANGKRNAYHVHCDVVGHKRPYAACLNICSQEGAGSSLYQECKSAVKRGDCPALKMRAEERAAGEALYFIERIRELAESTIERAVKFVSGSTPSKHQPVKSTLSNKSPMIDSGSYSDAINAAIKAAEAPAAPVVPSVKVEALPGESPLEMARRLLAQSKQ